MPLDTSIQNETLSYIQRSGYISYFVFEELDKDRKVYENVTQKDFINNFIISDDVVIKFQDYLNLKENANVTFVAYHDEMKKLIKAALADQLYGRNVYEEIINSNDDMIEEVIKLSQE